MRKALLLLCALMVSLPMTRLLAGGGEGDEEETQRETQRKSVFPNSYPGGPIAKSPLSTGYYVTDPDQPFIGQPWAPSYEYFDTLGNERQYWHRVLSGPNQRDAAFWRRRESEGYEYLRNPNNMGDSTNDAFAGPISIGFPFYYYGRKYDSFYVSTNGLVALSQRRYQYDEFGNRVAYEPFAYEFSVPGREQNVGGALVDPVADDYGYQNVALARGTQWEGRPNAGILNGVNSQFPTPARSTAFNASLPSPQLSVLAPLWDDCELPQWNATELRPDDFGKIYWRRDQTNNKLIIWYVNQSMIGTKFIPLLGNVGVQPRQLRADYQVVLNRSDSTVQFNYKRFIGNFTNGTGIGQPSNLVFRANATIGIQSHDQEFTNYLSNVNNGGNVYVDGFAAQTPHDVMAVRFKQWRNIGRVLSVTFQIPNRLDSGATFLNLAAGQLPNNFELLVGHPLLGVLRPVARVENVSSDVGPVNITAQPVQFSLVFRIRDLVNRTEPPVYQRSGGTRQLYKIENAPGTQNSAVARPNIDEIVFDPYYTSGASLRQVGRFRAEIIVTDQNPITGLRYGEQWPFDDTTGVRVFGMRRIEMPFINTFSDFDVAEDGIFPSVKNFVSIGAEVVDGDANTFNPPPPRGAFGTPPNILNSPVMRINRIMSEGVPYPPDAAAPRLGDTLLSFPINLSGTIKAPNLILSYQRAGRATNTSTFDRGWSDQTRHGPEHAVYNVQKNGILQNPDILWVEFAEPSPDAYERITNIFAQGDWQQVGFTDSTVGVITWNGTNNPSPRWGILGGGGGSDTSTTGKVIVNEYDAGKDFEFYRAVIPIPVRWSKNTIANRSFRFRIRELAGNDGNILGPVDEQDAFYIDNIMVMEPDKPEIEVTAVRVTWPYTEAPASQARTIPLAVKVANNGSSAATAFGVAMYVDQVDADGNSMNPPGQHNYYRFKSIVSLLAGRSSVEQFPSWNAQECGTEIDASTPGVTSTKYRIYGAIVPAGSDSYSGNDVQYTDFTLKLGPSFAYDDGTNDVPAISGITGKGLNLVPPTPDPTSTQPFGPVGGTSSGSFAMQFRILTRDTIRGYSAYFSGTNQSQDNIRYALFQAPGGGQEGEAPGATPVQGSIVYSQRGAGLPTTNQGRPYHFDQYVSVMLPQPIVLEPGYYFVSVSQLGETGIELGGDASRMGQVTTIRSEGPPLGNGNYSIPAHPEMMPIRFWYETTVGTGNWQPMLAPVNNPGFPHLNYTGTWPVSGLLTYSRGSWLPMIRPYFGNKYSTSCLVAEPVELSTFDLTELASAIRLDWATSAEVNNRGFNVERRVKGEENWASIGFREGAGTSNTPTTYTLTDADVARNVTYQYRLRQEDRDGSVNYSAIREGRLEGGMTGSATLSQNTPNPFSGSTRIEFSLPESQQVTLEITDALGSVVRTFTVEGKAGANGIEWDGTDANGSAVGSGAYVYKLSGNGFVLVNKMTVTR